MELEYLIACRQGTAARGRLPLDPEIHLSLPLAEAQPVSVWARAVLEEVPDTIFMNGYESWTWCPYYGPESKIRGLHQIPGFLLEKYAFASYGDYDFVNYPAQKGILHGESWCWFSRADGQIEFFGSLKEDNGYTLFRWEKDTNALFITKDLAAVLPKGQAAVLDLFHAVGSRQEVFAAWFARLGIGPCPAPALYGYSSWYNRYQNIDEKAIRQDLEGCAGLFERGDLFQIDDGWEEAVGDWLPAAGRFPSGMKAMTDAVHDQGFQAGLWLAPFAAQKNSRLVQEHPGWLLKQADGKPWCAGSNWQGFYALDIDCPEAVSYIEKTFQRVFEEWGFDLVKLDFLYAAAPFQGRTDSRAGRMYRAIDLLRKACGTHPILACGVPLMPAFGSVEYCRIGCDVSLDWNDVWYMRAMHRERNSTYHSLMNTISRRDLEGLAFRNDPDVFFLRDENLHLREQDKMDLARLDMLCAGVHLISDDPGRYDEEKKNTYRRLRRLGQAEFIDLEVLDRGVRVRFQLDGRQKEEILFPDYDLKG
jgi:alpha-galactosidase